MVETNIIDELSQNFIDFSYEANSCRAFADARDGLKPGQRACLWEMYKHGYTSNKPHVKSAKISGGVIANWWPHGNQAIYDTFARMSQDWINNIPEVDWHGGNGSQIISAEPSAERYTEARLSKATEEGLMYGIKKNNVPMQLNFSEDAEWPQVFPAILPRLMINGCQGIGMTIANVWLPHTLAEIVDVINHYINTNELDYSNLAPSFPSGGIIINKDTLSDIYKTGRGKVILRAVTEIKGNTIMITELPYQVYIEPLIDSIKELIKNGELDDIEEIYNKSDKKKLLIEIKCGNPQATLNKLFASTDLQKVYNANQWALVSKTPKLLNLKEYLDIYIAHNLECIQREYQFDYDKAQARLEIVNGLLKALEDIDNIIALIKHSASSAEAKDNLIKNYQFTEQQAKAIIDMKLGKLANLEKIELNKEREDLVYSLSFLSFVLNSTEEKNKVFLDRLNNLNKKYGKPRKTQLVQIDIKREKKEFVPAEVKDCVVIVSNNHTIKRIDAKNFKTQKRNTVGIKTNGDIIAFSQKTNTQDTLMVFTTKGKMYRILVDKIPEGSNNFTGIAINNLIEFEKDEQPIAYTTLTRDTAKKYIVFATKNGIVKKVPLEEYTNIKRTGIKTLNLREGDSLAAVSFINDEQIILVTRQGMAIKFESKDLPISSRIAQGVKGMNLNDNDEVIDLLIASTADEYFVVVTKNNLGKKVKLCDVQLQKRAGKGLSYSSSEIARAIVVNKNDKILVCGNLSSIVINEEELPLLSRTSIGNVILKNNKEVISIAQV